MTIGPTFLFKEKAFWQKALKPGASHCSSKHCNDIPEGKHTFDLHQCCQGAHILSKYPCFLSFKNTNEKVLEEQRRHQDVPDLEMLLLPHYSSCANRTFSMVRTP